MKEKVLISLLALYLVLISILIGGCTMNEPKAVTMTSKYPDRPITIIVPTSAGGAYDLIPRALEKTASQHLGQPLVVVNKPGGGGNVGWNELVDSTPDGYTIGVTGVEILLQPLYSRSQYHYPTALEPLVQISSFPMVLAIQANQPWENLDDLVTYAEQHPGQIKLGNSGMGSFPHVLGEMLAHNAGITIKHVPFRGGSESIAALLGGHIQGVFTTQALTREYLKNGTVRVLAVTSEQRLADPVFSSVPTFKELGLDIVFNNWVGLAAPKDIPWEVKAKLAEGLKKIIIDPEYKNALENIGLQVDYLNAEEFQMKWIEDNEKLTKVIQKTGVLDQIKEQKK